MSTPDERAAAYEAAYTRVLTHLQSLPVKAARPSVVRYNGERYWVQPRQPVGDSVSTVEFPWRDTPYPFDEANPPVEDDRPLWTSGWVFMAAVMVWALVGGTTILVPMMVLALSSLMSALDSRKPRWLSAFHAVLCGVTVASIIPLYLALTFLWSK